MLPSVWYWLRFTLRYRVGLRLVKLGFWRSGGWLLDIHWTPRCPVDACGLPCWTQRRSGRQCPRHGFIDIDLKHLLEETWQQIEAIHANEP